MSTDTDTTEAPVQGPREPNMIDVAAAVVAEDGVDSPALDALAFVAAHMEAEARWREDLTESMLIEANTKLLVTQHGLRAALDMCQSGGTTREYEWCLMQVRDVTNVTRYHDAYQFYEAQVREANGLIPRSPEIWPGFYPKHHLGERYM